MIPHDAAPPSEASDSLPLTGMRVLELTHAWAGPLCGMMLADMGAEVIKIESPAQKPEARGGFPYAAGESVIFMMTNRNKKSVAIDIKNERGRQTFLNLIRTADVLIQNMRPGALDRLGLSYEDVKTVNPRLIYTSLSGYGHTGPDARRAGVDQVAIAATGLAATTMAHASDTPVALGAPICDYVAAMWACHGTLCAYLARGKSGLGQKVDASLLGAGLSLMIGPTAMFFHTPGYTGYQTWINGPSEFVRAGDGRFVSVFASYPALWERLVRVLPDEGLGLDPLFTTREQRTKNVVALREALNRIFAREPANYWVELLSSAGVPVSLVRTIGEVLEDPQVIALEMIQECEHPTAGTLRVLGVPVRLSDTPGNVRQPAPLLGEHTDAVLVQAGISPNELSELREDDIVGGVHPGRAQRYGATS